MNNKSAAKKGSLRDTVLAIVLIFSVVYLGRGLGVCRVADVALLETPELVPPERERYARLQLRSQKRGEGHLLLKNSARSEIYSYDPNAGTLSLVANNFWENATGEIGDRCGGPPTSNPWLHIDDSDRLVDRDEQIETAGETALRFKTSPSGKFIAVLSANGFKYPSIIPFMGKGGTFGQHYHQLLLAKDLSATGRRVPLPFVTARKLFSPCWSPDERFVVYTEVLYHRITIVAVDVLEESR